MTVDQILDDDAASGGCKAIRRSAMQARMAGGDHVGKIVLTLGD